MALVIQAQKDLAADQDAEVQAMANYTHAKIVFDSAMGRTLEVNHISMKEALDGRVERESFLPADLPAAKPVEVPPMKRRNWRVAAAVWAAAALPCYGQQAPMLERPSMIGPIRSYMAPTVPPVRMTNSNRLYDLIRAGNLYLSLEDALALAIENNLNLEIDRYDAVAAGIGAGTHQRRRSAARRSPQHIA